MAACAWKPTTSSPWRLLGHDDAPQRAPGEDVAWSDEVEHLIAAANVEAPLDAQIAEWLTAEPAGRVADIGCGPGAMTLALLARSPDVQVDAVDGEPMMLGAARERLTAAGLGAQAEFRLGDLDSLELAEVAYDWSGPAPSSTTCPTSRRGSTA